MKSGPWAIILFGVTQSMISWQVPCTSHSHSKMRHSALEHKPRSRKRPPRTNCPANWKQTDKVSNQFKPIYKGLRSQLVKIFKVQKNHKENAIPETEEVRDASRTCYRRQQYRKDSMTIYKGVCKVVCVCKWRRVLHKRISWYTICCWMWRAFRGRKVI